MKRKDFILILGIIALFAPFFISPGLLSFYKQFNLEHGMIMSFIKFAILATLGEVIGLRIKTGNYNQKGFGIIPRAIVWGVLGLTIQMSFIIFPTGAPRFLEYLGMEGASQALSLQGLPWQKILTAFIVSATMNTIFAPVMMTIHKITDIHIERNGGTISGLFKPIQMGDIMASINWKVQWGFVFKKTIPFFWIPAHTITFLLPPEYRVLFAAILGIVLGILLAMAAVMGKNK